MKMIYFLLLITVYAPSYCQQAEANSSRGSTLDYLSKSKRQNKVGKVMLFTGAALIITSAIIPKGELVRRGLICGPGSGILCNEKYKNDGIKTAFFVGGVVSLLGSVPFFISAKRNRKRASTIGLEWEDVDERSPLFANGPFPVVKVDIAF